MATEETGRLLKLNRLAGNLGEESAKADFDQSPQYNAKPHSLRGRPSLRVKDPALNQDNKCRSSQQPRPTERLVRATEVKHRLFSN